MREPKICLIMIAETKPDFPENEVDMRYEHTVKGRFLERPNRFIAYVEVNGQRVICHVKIQDAAENCLPPAVPWCWNFTPTPGKWEGKQNLT